MNSARHVPPADDDDQPLDAVELALVRALGAAIAKRLAREGAAVAVTYASSPQKAAEVVRAIEAEGGRALAIAADVTDKEAI